MAGETYRLIVRRGPQPNQTFELNKDILTLGRDITNDIVINDPEVSRHHLRFTRGAEGFSIEDLGSTNGTFLGGQRLSGTRALRRGDMIGLGETVTLSYDLARAGEEGAAPPGGDEQYRPPQQPQPQQPQAQPQRPQYQQPQQPQQPAQPQPQPSYDAPPPPQEYGYGQQQQPDYGYSPQAPGYDYDPYAVREEEPSSAWRWIIIGCVGMLLFCCCATVLGMFIIDQANMWCKIPIFSDIVTPIISALAEAVGIIQKGAC